MNHRPRPMEDRGSRSPIQEKKESVPITASSEYI